MEHEPTPRLRQSPAERFAGPQHLIELASVAARLREEIQSGGHGHRQESLYKRGKTSVSLFLFEPQARLASHRAKGTVVIQVLTGRFVITAEGQANNVGPGGLLVLASGVEHDLVAHEASEMLLTVHLDA
jgi:quercetin dioxygenase-like cupin family protein